MDGFMANRTSMVGVILVILVILVARQMVAAAILDGAGAYLHMVAAAKFVTAMVVTTANTADMVAGAITAG